MEKVGLNEQVIAVLETINKVGELSWGCISLDRTSKEIADQQVETLLNDGFQLKQTTYESYDVTRELYVPGVNFSIRVHHKPSDADKIEVLQEKMRKAQLELEVLTKGDVE